MVNLDVFTHVITWFITLVADHEEIKQELRDEVMANKDNILGYLAETNTHLHRCFYESMRIRPFTSESLNSEAWMPIPSANYPQSSLLENVHLPLKTSTVSWSTLMWVEDPFITNMAC